ncbi:MAG TPA: sigma factor, partial [Kribbellaceae bacterium]|nr:sigma factor [Kribbellaceae bacterium]
MYTESHTEQELLGAARGGDQDAFNDLVARHRDRVRLHCYRMLGSFHDADDAVQETLVKAWSKIGRFEQRSSFGT